MTQEAAQDEQERRIAAETAHNQMTKLLGSITDAFMIIDEHWQYTYLNPEAERLVRCQPEEIIGKNIWELPDMVDSLFHQEYHRAVSEQIVVQFEVFYKPFDSWFEVRASPFEKGLAAYFRDITARKRLEEELRRREREFSTLVENSPDIIFRLDCNLRHLYISPSVEQASGIKPQQFLGKSGRELGIVPQACDVFEAKCQEALTTGQVTWMEFSDAGRQYRSRIIPERALDGSIESLMGITEDITERKRVQRHQRAQYAVTRVLAESTTLAEAVPTILQSLCESLEWQLGAIWTVDHQANILRCVNSWQAPTVEIKEFTEATQHTTFTLGVGLPGRIWESRQPVWIKELSEDDNFSRAALATRAGLHTAFGFPICLGEEVLGVIECFSDKIQEPDEDLLQLMIVIGSQIGQFIERKRTEAALQESQSLFQNFMDHSPITAFIKDEAGQYVYVNPLVERLFNCQLSDWVGKTDFDFFPDEIAQLVRKNDLAVLQAGETVQMLERVPFKDGEHHYMSIKFPFQEGSGRQLLAGMSIDVTEQIRAEEALRESEEKYRSIFETAGVSIWEEDFTQVHSLLEELKAQGVTDLRQYLNTHPELLQAAIQGVQIRDVNQQTLKMFGAKTKAELLDSLHNIFAPETRSVFLEEMIALAEGRRYLESETILQTLQGEKRHVLFTVTFPEPEAGYERVLVSILDITERKRAAEALRQSEERLRVALKHSPITVFHQDRELRYTWKYNPVVDSEAETALGKRDIDLLPPDDAEVLTRIKSQVLQTGVGAREEVKITMQGQDSYFDLTVEPLRDAEHQIMGVTCAAIDISERKQAEMALRESQTLLNALLTSSPIGLAFLDRDLRYIHANEALAAINGLPLSEHLGRTLWDVLPEWAPQLVPIFQQVMQTKEPLLNQELSGEIHLLGVYRHCLVSYYPVCLPDGQLLGVGVSSIEVTELKRIEQALREALQKLTFHFENTPLAVIERDRDFRITRWSHSAEKIFGWQGSEVLGQDLQAVYEEDLAAVQNVRARLISGQEKQNISHNRSYTKDGSIIHCEWYNSALLDAAGNLVSILSLVLDVTERKRSEVERMQLLERERTAREEAEAANRIKDEFLAVLSHELRSPLNPILGWTQLLRSRKLDEAATDRALETIERNAKLQTQLIEDLLDVSRILRGKMTLEVEPVNLVKTIEGALETVQLAAQAKEIQIQTMLDATGGMVSGDANRLQQVVWNLLSNAVKFTPPGGQVEVWLECVGAEAQIQVRDTGSGISPQFLPYVFEYFRQADSTTTRKFGGLGLGLAIVRHLVELHGGSVWAESPGKGLGATFTVRLSLMMAHPENTQEVVPAEQSADLSGLRALVVDDEADIRELIAFILEESGAEVTIATSAQEAFAALNRVVPDVLLCDIGMPEMDGYMLIRQLRTFSAERGGHVPAIALTAYAGEQNQRQALAAGFQLHLPKPVEPEVLLRAIISLVGR